MPPSEKVSHSLIQALGPQGSECPPRDSAQALSFDSRQAASLPAASYLGDPEVEEGEKSRLEGPRPGEWGRRSQVPS